MHRGYDRAAYHFIQALGIPSIAKIKGKLSQKKGKKRAKSNDSDNEDDNEREVGNSEDPNLDEDEDRATADRAQWSTGDRRSEPSRRS